MERIPVDGEVSHDGDSWFTSLVYDTVPLCQDHLNEYKEREGIFNPNEYKE